MTKRAFKIFLTIVVIMFCAMCGLAALIYYKNNQKQEEQRQLAKELKQSEVENLSSGAKQVYWYLKDKYNEKFYFYDETISEFPSENNWRFYNTELTSDYPITVTTASYSEKQKGNTFQDNMEEVNAGKEYEQVINQWIKEHGWDKTIKSVEVTEIYTDTTKNHITDTSKVNCYIMFSESEINKESFSDVVDALKEFMHDDYPSCSGTFGVFLLSKSDWKSLNKVAHGDIIKNLPKYHLVDSYKVWKSKKRQ